MDPRLCNATTPLVVVTADDRNDERGRYARYYAGGGGNHHHDDDDDDDDDEDDNGDHAKLLAYPRVTDVMGDARHLHQHHHQPPSIAHAMMDAVVMPMQQQQQRYEPPHIQLRPSTIVSPNRSWSPPAPNRSWSPPAPNRSWSPPNRSWSPPAPNRSWSPPRKRLRQQPRAPLSPRRQQVLVTTAPAAQLQRKSFVLERATTTRAKCRLCKHVLRRNEWRIGKILSRVYRTALEYKAWYHIRCLLRSFCLQLHSKVIVDPARDVQGWQWFDEKDAFLLELNKCMAQRNELLLRDELRRHRRRGVDVDEEEEDDDSRSEWSTPPPAGSSTSTRERTEAPPGTNTAAEDNVVDDDGQRRDDEPKDGDGDDDDDELFELQRLRRLWSWSPNQPRPAAAAAAGHDDDDRAHVGQSLPRRDVQVVVVADEIPPYLGSYQQNPSSLDHHQLAARHRPPDSDDKGRTLSDGRPALSDSYHARFRSSSSSSSASSATTNRSGKQLAATASPDCYTEHPRSFYERLFADTPSESLFSAISTVFDRLRRLPSYQARHEALCHWLTFGSNGVAFASDRLRVLWVRLLLPRSHRRTYGIRAKQMFKFFSTLLHIPCDQLETEVVELYARTKRAAHAAVTAATEHQRRDHNDDDDDGRRQPFDGQPYTAKATNVHDFTDALVAIVMGRVAEAEALDRRDLAAAHGHRRAAPAADDLLLLSRLGRYRRSHRHRPRSPSSRGIVAPSADGTVAVAATAGTDERATPPAVGDDAHHEMSSSSSSSFASLSVEAAEEYFHRLSRTKRERDKFNELRGLLSRCRFTDLELVVRVIVGHVNLRINHLLLERSLNVFGSARSSSVSAATMTRGRCACISQVTPVVTRTMAPPPPPPPLPPSPLALIIDLDDDDDDDDDHGAGTDHGEEDDGRSERSPHGHEIAATTGDGRDCADREHERHTDHGPSAVASTVASHCNGSCGRNIGTFERGTLASLPVASAGPMICNSDRCAMDDDAVTLSSSSSVEHRDGPDAPTSSQSIATYARTPTTVAATRTMLPQQRLCTSSPPQSVGSPPQPSGSDGHANSAVDEYDPPPLVLIKLSPSGDETTTEEDSGEEVVVIEPPPAATVDDDDVAPPPSSCRRSCEPSSQRCPPNDDEDRPQRDNRAPPTSETVWKNISAMPIRKRLARIDRATTATDVVREIATTVTAAKTTAATTTTVMAAARPPNIVPAISTTVAAPPTVSFVPQHTVLRFPQSSSWSWSPPRPITVHRPWYALPTGHAVRLPPPGHAVRLPTVRLAQRPPWTPLPRVLRHHQGVAAAATSVARQTPPTIALARGHNNIAAAAPARIFRRRHDSTVHPYLRATLPPPPLLAFSSPSAAAAATGTTSTTPMATAAVAVEAGSSAGAGANADGGVAYISTSSGRPLFAVPLSIPSPPQVSVPRVSVIEANRTPRSSTAVVSPPPPSLAQSPSPVVAPPRPACASSSTSVTSAVHPAPPP